MTNLLKVRNICKSIDNKQILSDVSLNIDKGELLVCSALTVQARLQHFIQSRALLTSTLDQLFTMMRKYVTYQCMLDVKEV